MACSWATRVPCAAMDLLTLLPPPFVVQWDTLAPLFGSLVNSNLFSREIETQIKHRRQIG